MQFWKKLTHEQRKNRIQQALQENVNFSNDASLGYPASKLDGKVFYDDAPFLKDAPTLQTYVANPNNIGCHTFGTSEKAFSGTQDIEREVLNVLAVDIFKLNENEFDVKVERRYSDFKFLDTILNEEFYYLVLPILPKKNVKFLIGTY